MPEVLALFAIAILITLAMWLDDRAGHKCFCGQPKAMRDRFCPDCEAEVSEWL